LAAATPYPAALRLTVVDAVLGILAHTRWPQRPARPLLLCVNERSSAAADMRSLHSSVPAGKLAPVRLIDLADALPLDCDAVWLGTGAPAAEPLPQLIGRPVLSMGEGTDFCSRGGMFCLVPRNSDLRVEINLDTVARSGLHVHPLVLKIGQPRPGVTP
ncbi:YfiR family protein, partial [Sphaerotilus sp.]|uniref:YfiR family protein n=1 Tax=Sphaerotilus sp. TaxID=2093942 RepID=UPI0034E293A5